MKAILELADVTDQEKTQLVNYMRVHPVIWQQGQTKAQGAVDSAWEFMANALTTPERVFEIPLCKKIWKNLRDHYVRVAKTGKLPSTNWQHKDALAFLGTEFKSRPRKPKAENDGNEAAPTKRAKKSEVKDEPQQQEMAQQQFANMNQMQQYQQQFGNMPLHIQQQYGNMQQQYPYMQNGQMQNPYMNGSPMQQQYMNNGNLPPAHQPPQLHSKWNDEPPPQSWIHEEEEDDEDESGSEDGFATPKHKKAPVEEHRVLQPNSEHGGNRAVSEASLHVQQNTSNGQIHEPVETGERAEARALCESIRAELSVFIKRLIDLEEKYKL